MQLDQFLMAVEKQASRFACKCRQAITKSCGGVRGEINSRWTWGYPRCELISSVSQTMPGGLRWWIIMGFPIKFQDCSALSSSEVSWSHTFKISHVWLLEKSLEETATWHWCSLIFSSILIQTLLQWGSSACKCPGQRIINKSYLSCNQVH